MLCFRVCHEIEAAHQNVGEHWRVAPGKREVYHHDVKGIYLSVFPEQWRRNLNFQCLENMGIDDFFYTHTLLVEVPDEALEIPYFHVLVGMEYRLRAPHLAIVRGIAGPDWDALPDWLPQPRRKSEWDPYSREYLDWRISYWLPRNKTARDVWYHPSHAFQEEQCERFHRRKRSGRRMVLDPAVKGNLYDPL
jgi:hypothetical protein